MHEHTWQITNKDHDEHREFLPLNNINFYRHLSRLSTEYFHNIPEFRDTSLNHAQHTS